MGHYLATALFPSKGEAHLGLRNVRELRTLALVGDSILQGELATALDVLVQRMKAIEVAAEQGTWVQARWMELVPPSDVSSWDREDLRLAMREQDLDVRLGLSGPRRGRSRSSRRDDAPPLQRSGGARAREGGGQRVRDRTRAPRRNRRDGPRNPRREGAPAAAAGHRS